MSYFFLESTITYSLDGQSDLSTWFLLDSVTGVIRTNVSLDYEHTSSYRFTVVAKDAGVPSLRDKAQVLVNVLDVNDNRPYFAITNYSITVTESSQINREVFKAVAVDKDSGLNAALRYSLLSGDAGNTFTIDPITGKYPTIFITESLLTVSHCGRSCTIIHYQLKLLFQAYLFWEKFLESLNIGRLNLLKLE